MGRKEKDGVLKAVAIAPFDRRIGSGAMGLRAVE
jgi:hypothetical protein